MWHWEAKGPCFARALIEQELYRGVHPKDAVEISAEIAR